MKRLALLCLVALVACGRPAEKQGPPEAARETPPPPAEALATDAWVGRWIGPEGLFLDIKARDASGNYPLTLKDNLDTQADYVATPSGEGLAFHRGDDAVTIRAGTGVETGFKYLAGKRDCLILVAGQEGYCRD